MKTQITTSPEIDGGLFGLIDKHFNKIQIKSIFSMLTINYQYYAFDRNMDLTAGFLNPVCIVNRYSNRDCR